jgi:formate/nitrite transporter
MEAATHSGLSRSLRDVQSLFSASFLGGVFLSFSGMLYCHVTGGSPGLKASNPGLHSLVGGLVFPTGLSMIVLTGGDLLTSNFYYQSFPIFAQPAHAAEHLRTAARVLVVSTAGNAASSFLAAAAVSSFIFPPNTVAADAAARLCERKLGQGMPTVFAKAIAANFLVCTAVFMALTSATPAGKIAALWGPITCFVTLGLEHSVANMFLLPFGYLSGADVSAAAIFTDNLIPVIIGNGVGAVAFARLKLSPSAMRGLRDKFNIVV